MTAILAQTITNPKHIVISHSCIKFAICIDPNDIKFFIYFISHYNLHYGIYIYIFFVDYTTNTCMLYKLYIYIYYDLVQLILFTKYARY